MNHQEIEQHEMSERYVLHQLGAEERRAFQEHYFNCEACFEEVQMTARMIAAVRSASRLEGFGEPRVSAPANPAHGLRFAWLKPALALAALAAIVLAGALGWLWLRHIPELRTELSNEKQARQELEREKQESLRRTQEELQSERRQLELARGEQARLQSQIEDLARQQASQKAQATIGQANEPIVILESTRDSLAGSEIKLPANASRLTLWIEVELKSGFDSFQLQLVDAGNRPRQTIRGLQANSYGALAVTISAKQLQTGKYLVKLLGMKGRQSAPVGEYELNVRR